MCQDVPFCERSSLQRAFVAMVHVVCVACACTPGNLPIHLYEVNITAEHMMQIVMCRARLGLGFSRLRLAKTQARP